MDGAFGAQGADAPERLSENLAVEEEDGVEGLVLGAGGHVVPGSQLREEALQLGFAGEAHGQGRERGHIAAEPEDVALLGGEGFVLAAEDLSEPLDCFGRVRFLGRV